MKKYSFILFLLATLPAWSQNVEFTDHQGRVVDATTGKPLANVKVTHAIGGQSDAKGRFTVRYYSTESNYQVIVSHPGYCTDTFSHAPAFVSLRRTTASSQKGRPKVAVVLSGGGAKGVAHIGALKVIEEAGIPVDMVCGTSMGALVGALYSVGYSTDFLDSLVRSQDWAALLSDRTDPAYLTLRQREEQNTYVVIRGLGGEQPQRGGLIRGRNLDMLFRRLCAGYLDSISFDSLPRPFACIATDIVTNQEVVFHSGHLIQAMRASMAIPGVFTPVRMGDMVLLDGGLRNNYPADVARAMGADIVIGISVQDLMTRSEDINDVGAVMGQLISINSRNKFTDNIKLSDIFIHVDVSGYSAASFTNASIDTLLQRGEKATRSLWDQLIVLRKRNHIDSVTASAFCAPTGDSQEQNMKLSQTFRIVNSPVASAGFRFDTEEMGALQINVKIPLHTRMRSCVAGTVRLGKRIMARGELSMLSHHSGFNPTLSYTFRNNDLDIYTAGTRTYNVRYRQHTAEFTPLDLRLNRYDIRGGIRWDFFNYYGQLLSNGSDIPSLDDNQYISYHVSTDLNNENDWYFPTSGTRFHAAYAYRTDNFYGLGDKAGISDLIVHWRMNILLGERWALQPMLYGRLLSTDETLAFTSFIGGDWFSHTVEQQLPMTGFGHIELCDRHFAATQLQLQYNIFKNHYLLLRVAGAYQTDDLTQLNNEGLIIGAQAGYSLNTLIGPIDARIGYSSLTRKPYFFINIGHVF
ncbi:MAG: patatin-like phospholipase family protein [Bacteroidales bacterium]|nr:patatin-like phospholipase family protein [Bacteroidales bacterium]